jgi:lysophospholipase L1-like esterase
MQQMEKLMTKILLALAIAIAPAAQCAAQEVVWTGSWAASPVAAPAKDTDVSAAGATYRDIVHLSLGGKAIRLRISNEFGTSPLALGSVHAAMSAGMGAIKPASDHTVTFGALESVKIPAGAVIVSDPVAMPVEAFADVAVSLYVPAQSGRVLTYHALGMSTNYVAPQNVVAAASMDDAKKVTSWFLLKGIDVDAGPKASAVVVLGASIADGYHSTPDKNARWPNVLAERLAAKHVGVLNEGISGNRLLHDGTGPSAIARLDRDVLAQSGAKYVIVSLGTNDIGRTFFPTHPDEEVTADEMIWCLQQLASRAHARGMKIYGTTLSPFAGAFYYSAAGDKMRQAVNAFVLSNKVFDGFIDFDKVVQDPAHPETLLPKFDSGDHLHPNDDGYRAMAESIDLKLFEK